MVFTAGFEDLNQLSESFPHTDSTSFTDLCMTSHFPLIRIYIDT